MRIKHADGYLSFLFFKGEKVVTLMEAAVREKFVAFVK